MKTLINILIILIILCFTAACSATTGATTANAGDALISAVTSGEVSMAASQVVSAAGVLAANTQTRADALDDVWDSADVIPIVFNGDSIAAQGQGVALDGSTLTITAAGTYSLSGVLTDGRVIVHTTDSGIVRLVLNGVDIRSSSGPAIYIQDAETAVIILAGQSQNTLTGGSNAVLEGAAEDEPNAALFSKSDLAISGSGALSVNGNYADGITSKDGLIIGGGTIVVNALDDGMRGKDYLVIEDGTITVNAQGNGLLSDNDTDAALGYISIENGILQVTSGGDAIQAATDVVVADGTVTLTAGGGSGARLDANTSAKGIKGTVSVVIDGGAFTIDSADDALHSNGSLVVNGGVFMISSADDGMHADATLEINDGEISIAKSYEGLESSLITINAGTIHLTASDDGLNAASGSSSLGTNQQAGPGSAPQQDAYASSGGNFLTINGGRIVIDAGGDGVDVNGGMEMTGGVVIVNGPTEQMNGALDYDSGFNMTGGVFIAAGSAGMAMAPDETSSQDSLLINFDTTLAAGELVHIENSQGEDILTFAATKPVQSIAFSSPDLVNGVEYIVYTGGSASGSVADGLYQDATYMGGTQAASFTVSSVVTMIGNSRGFHGGHP
jgi:hypothetical protein